MPDLAMAQASPFMTGATALQTNARLAREYLVALPVELSPPQRIELVRGFSRELSDRYGFAIDVALHAPRDFPGSDPRNYHAHLLATTREANIEGLGGRTTLDVSDARRRELGLKPAVYEWLHVRERWATVTNEALEEARVAVRVDHRSLEAQHIDREPRLHIPRAAFEMERHGYRSVVAERLREEYDNRVRMRAAKTAAVEHAAAAQPAAADSAANVGTARPQSLEEIRREARENWLRYKESRSQGESQGQSRSQGQHPGEGRSGPAAAGTGREDDLAY
jgi:ATP-dependent exoDNAse (exonuclease V) alpha subunit